jgi:hypothetical protein
VRPRVETEGSEFFLGFSERLDLKIGLGMSQRAMCKKAPNRAVVGRWTSRDKA